MFALLECRSVPGGWSPVFRMIDSSTHYNVIQCRRLHGNNSKNVADAQSRKLHDAAATCTRLLLKTALRGIADPCDFSQAWIQILHLLELLRCETGLQTNLEDANNVSATTFSAHVTYFVKKEKGPTLSTVIVIIVTKVVITACLTWMQGDNTDKLEELCIMVHSALADSYRCAAMKYLCIAVKQ